MVCLPLSSSLCSHLHSSADFPPFQILETLKLETKLKQYEGDAKAQGKDGAKIDQAGGASEIGNLRKKLEQKDRDLENLKKQAEGLNKEYRELSDKYAATQPSGGSKKDK